MGWKQCVIKCMDCGKETALIGEDIDKKYTVEYYERQGWVFHKYDVKCPACKEKSKQEWEQIGLDLGIK